MVAKNSNDDFTFSIEGKDYTISEKSDLVNNKQKQNLHAPSLTIGAIISGICIAVIFFGIGDDLSEPLVEKQLVEEPTKSPQISMDTFIQNGSPMLGSEDATITLIEFGDYQCHFCNVYYHNTEHKIYEDYVVTGKVKIIQFQRRTVLSKRIKNKLYICLL